MSVGIAVEKEQVADAARGYWRSLILQLVPAVSESHLTGRHGPCPKCGGQDRWRTLAGFNETGAAYCNQCFSSRNGDGFSLLQWANGWTFPRALQEVAAVLGLAGTAKPKLRKTTTAPAKKKVDPFAGWTSREVTPEQLSEIVHAFAAAKPGVDPQAVLASEPKIGQWRDADRRMWDVIAFIGHKLDPQTGQLRGCAVHVYRQDGEWFPACERGTAGKRRKNQNVYGSENGWLIVGGWERFRSADVIWKVEGLTDAFAILPLLPAHHSVVTMTNGCAWSSRSDRMPPLSIFAGRRVVVCGDADLPGQAGCESFAGDAATVASAVFVCRLPYPVEPREGKDLRDWVCADEYNWSHLRQLLVEWNWLLQSRLDLFGESARASSRRSFNQLDQTDTGNAAHYAAYAQNLLRYNYSWSRWLCWDGARWRNDDQGRPVSIAKRVLDEMQADAAAAMDTNAMMFVAKSSRRERINAMIALSQDCLSVQTGQLDQDRWALNCPNGTVDLRSGELRLHRQEDYITKVCGTVYDANAAAPRWETFLAEVFADHPEIPGFLQRFFGCCLTGDTSEQRLPVFWGEGSNGKSTLLNTVKTVIGNDYTMQAQSDLLIDRRNDQHPTELADLFGKRLVICAETEHGRRLAEAKLKALTGGEPVRARRMREDFWEFIPEMKLVLVTNHKPQVWGTDFGVWRRLLLVPFTQTFGEDRRDPELPERLAEEQSGVLAWMVRGCLDWQAGGLRPPEDIVRATADYAASEDVIGRFVSECCVMLPTAAVRAKELHNRFRSWADDNGEPPLSMKRIGAWLTQHGVERQRSGGILWRGVGLLSESEAAHAVGDDFIF